ncbi:MAG: DpnII family type II restriction endonuclease, partial [Paludibacteraceae bacterium]
QRECDSKQTRKTLRNPCTQLYRNQTSSSINMSAHTTEQFNLFMSQLRETNATLDFYCDFPKIARNVADIEMSLNMLNYLIGKENLREAVQSLWNRDPHVFEVMDILIATRKKDDKKYIDNDGSMHSVHSLFSSVDGVMKFLEGTGLDRSS